MQQKKNGKIRKISFSKYLLDLGLHSFPLELVECIIHLISYSEILETGELCAVSLPRYPGCMLNVIVRTELNVCAPDTSRLGGEGGGGYIYIYLPRHTGKHSLLR